MPREDPVGRLGSGRPAHPRKAGVDLGAQRELARVLAAMQPHTVRHIPVREIRVGVGEAEAASGAGRAKGAVARAKAPVVARGRLREAQREGGLLPHHLVEPALHWLRQQLERAAREAGRVCRAVAAPGGEDGVVCSRQGARGDVAICGRDDALPDGLRAIRPRVASRLRVREGASAVGGGPEGKVPNEVGVELAAQQQVVNLPPVQARDPAAVEHVWIGQATEKFLL
mmetsp:Transcript_38892/g.122116  ORF Transcript_38892/g.122116 Transcript_38892/m.122116 type:complete len:228 (+) Transcript_38892:167-850(+)